MGTNTIKELNDIICGATGVGELNWAIKAAGEFYSKPNVGSRSLICDNPGFNWVKRCGELHIPVGVHVAEDTGCMKPDYRMTD